MVIEDNGNLYTGTQADIFLSNFWGKQYQIDEIKSQKTKILLRIQLPSPDINDL